MCRLLPVLLLLLLSLSLCASSISFVIASAATPCTYNGFDFTSLNKPAGYQVTTDYTYRWQICGIYTADATCASKSGALCLYSGASFVFAAAKDVTTPSAAVWSTTGNGAKLTYNNGDVVTNKAATVNIELQCGDDAKTPTAAFDTKNFIINVVQYTQLACKSGPPGPDGPSGGDSGSSDGLSGGWIFVIILLVSITLYVVFGCVYKTKQQGTRGVESCPNIDFWRELPRLVRDGCVFTFVKLRSLCGGSHSSMSGKGEYDSLK